MKRPIEPSEIKRGDLIRAGFGTVKSTRMTALEYRAESDGDRYSDDAVAWQLLDRPAPAVESPTEPTLGWLHGPEPSPLLDMWVKQYTQREEFGVSGEATGTWAKPSEVTAFIPAIAVPREALDILREGHPVGRKCLWVSDFLAAVDEANR